MNAQDQLIKKNGDTLSIKVIELNERHLIYNKIGVPEERVFTTPLSKLLSLTYSNGRFVGFDLGLAILDADPSTINNSSNNPNPKLHLISGFLSPQVYSGTKKYTREEIESLFLSTENQQALELFKNGKSSNAIGNALGFTTGFLLGYELSSLINERETKEHFLVLGVVGVVLSGWLSSLGEQNMRKAISNYNENVRLKFKLDENGFGLAYVF